MEPNGNSRTAPARILIVEDETLVALDLEDHLCQLGYSIAGVCRSAPEVIHWMIEGRPDLVLMDIRIGGDVDGIDLARKMVDEFGVAVVFLTAHSDQTTLDRAKGAGSFGYVVKPFNFSLLAVAIEIALDRHHDQKTLRDQGEWLASVLANISEGVVVTNESGTVRFMNSVAEELTGWTQAEALNQPVATVLPVYDLHSGSGIAELIQSARLERRSVAIPARLCQRALAVPSLSPASHRKSGNFAIEGGVAHTPSAGCVITFRDVTARLQEELAIMDRDSGPFVEDSATAA